MSGASVSRSPGDPWRHRRGRGVLGLPEIRPARRARGRSPSSARASAVAADVTSARSVSRTRPSAEPDRPARRPPCGARERWPASGPPRGPPGAAASTPPRGRPRRAWRARPSRLGRGADGPRRPDAGGMGPSTRRSSPRSCRLAVSTGAPARAVEHALGEPGHEPAALVEEHVGRRVRAPAEVLLELARPFRRPPDGDEAEQRLPGRRKGVGLETRPDAGSGSGRHRHRSTATSASSLSLRHARGHPHAADRERRLARPPPEPTGAARPGTRGSRPDPRSPPIGPAIA